jgi:hypothetical protein
VNPDPFPRPSRSNEGVITARGGINDSVFDAAKLWTRQLSAPTVCRC